MKKRLACFLIIAGVLLLFSLPMLMDYNEGVSPIVTMSPFIQELSDEEVEAEHSRQLQQATRRNRFLNIYSHTHSVYQHSERAWTPWRYFGNQGYVLSAGQSLTINPSQGSNILILTPDTAQYENRVKPQIRNEIDRREYRLYVSRSANGPWVFHDNIYTNAVRASQGRLVTRP